MPTKQETFDTVVAHLRKQGCKAEDDHGNCMYRGKNGTKCGAGCLIPDDEYYPELEGSGMFDRSGKISACGRILQRLGNDIQLVNRLQGIHDGFTVGTWEERLGFAAEDHGLQYTPPADTSA